MPIATVFLAAGQGTRMNSDTPKVLHPVAGAPMLVHAMTAAARAGTEQSVVVVGTGAEAVAEVAQATDPRVAVVTQADQLGTAHAAGMAATALAGFDGTVFVMLADTPFVRPETLQAMAEAKASGTDLVILGFEAADPTGYGRLVMDADGLAAIVEEKDARPEERAITLCNSGVLCADRGLLFSLIAEIGNDNAKGEFYLTDAVALARARGLSAQVVRCDEAETLGINSRQQLAAAEAAFQARARAAALENGTTLTAPETVFFAHDTVVGRDVTIAPNVVFGPGVTVETGATIHAFCHLEGCHISAGASVGPFARLRPGAELGNDSRVGNFVEVKNAVIDEGAKVNHLSYIGDAHVGERANIGAGTITCNYDGVSKHHTEIGREAFIGSNSALIAPVSIGDGALVGSGSVISKSVAPGALALTRAPEVQKPGFAARFFAALRAKRTE